MSDCLQRLITLLITGRLDDEWARDKNSVLSCAMRAVADLCNLAAERLSPDHPHAIGDDGEDQKLAIAALEVAEALDLDVPELDEEGPLGNDDEEPAEFLPIWASILIPVAIRALEKLWEKRKKRRLFPRR